jgi:hypothetical protein
MSKFFKSKKQEIKPPAPRELKVIEQELSQVVAAAGVAQYRMYVLEQELAHHNQVLLRLNQEGAARQQLDAEAKAAVAKEGEAQ